MGEFLEIILEPWALRALLASTMVGVTCGLLGCFIVLRNMSLIGDALAHAILPGVVVAFLLFGVSTFGFFMGALVAGLLAAVFITWIQDKIKTKNDAAIGIVFTAMFSLGVMGISYINRRPGVHLDLKDFLFGNVLGVSNEDLWLTFIVLCFVVVSVIVFYRYLFATTFQPVIAKTMGISVELVHYFLMLLLAISVVAALQTVGVILVVAMLITPASTALLLTTRLTRVLVIAALIGLISAILGLVFAIILDTTPGPAMAVVATLIYLLVAIFAPTRGLLSRFFHKSRLQKRIQLEDTLKRAFQLEEQGDLSIEQLQTKLDYRSTQLQRHLQELRSKKFLQKRELTLTEEGRDAAQKLIRTHRLWETYLVEKLGLTEAQIHEDAEKYEHLLTEELVDELDQQLGFPKIDPHGSPIPKKNVQTMLSQLLYSQQANILQRQINQHIQAQLWALGLLPNTPLCIQQKSEKFIEIEQNDKTVRIPIELARQVSVRIA